MNYYNLAKTLEAAHLFMDTQQSSYFEKRLRALESDFIHFSSCEIVSVSERTLLESLTLVTPDRQEGFITLMKHFRSLGYCAEPEPLLMA